MKGTNNLGKEEFIMSPKVDFCLKELMHNKKVQIGFSAAILHIAPERILDTQMLPTEMPTAYEDGKLGILDVRLRQLLRVEPVDEVAMSGEESMTENQMDIEIQVLPFRYWAERSLFYVSKMISDQMQKGDPYDKICKCIHVGILDFKLFEDTSKFYYCFHLWEDTCRLLYTDKIEIHILELPSLKKASAEIRGQEPEIQRWAAFFNATGKEEMEMVAKTDEYIAEAYEDLVRISGDEKKRLEYEARMKALRDYNQQARSFHADGLRQGRQEGRREGLQEGRREGRQEGRREGLQEGLQEGIQALILDNLEDGKPEALILEKLKKRFQLTSTQAQSYWEQYALSNPSSVSLRQK